MTTLKIHSTQGEQATGTLQDGQTANIGDRFVLELWTMDTSSEYEVIAVNGQGEGQGAVVQFVRSWHPSNGHRLESGSRPVLNGAILTRI